MGISGTYDVLLLAILLPKSDVVQLLPADLRSVDTLLPVPDEIIETLGPPDTGKEMHPVFLQMGYQIGTGPGPSWLPKFSFNECKFELPFLRHPKDESNQAYTFKQHIVFSNTIIKMGSQASGLRSSTADFSPPEAPAHVLAGEESFRYTADGFLDATARKTSGQSGSSSWPLHRDLLESWWFGGGTGKTVQKFNFDWETAPISPEAYEVTVELDLSAFADPGSTLTKTQVRGQGWRTRATLTSQARSLAEM